MTFAYGSFSLDVDPYTVGYEADPFQAPEWQHVSTPYGTRPGGVLTPLPPGLRTITLSGVIKASVQTGAWELARDAMLTAFSVPKQRLQAGFTGDRFIIASLQAFQSAVAGPGHGTWTATFIAEDAYLSALTPSGDIQGGAYSLLPGSTAAYGSRFAVTPGGSAPTPVRALWVVQAGSPTPLLMQLTNLTAPGRPALAVSDTVPAGSLLTIDGLKRRTRIADMASVVGYWPCEEGSGGAFDFSGNSRDLGLGVAPNFRQDGHVGSALAFDGSTQYLTSAAAGFGVTAALTVCGWFYPTAAAFGIPVGKASLNQGYGLEWNGTTGAWGINWGTGAVGTEIYGQTGHPLNRWYFVAATLHVASNRTRVWVGTEEQAPRLEVESTATALAASAGAFTVGRGVWAPGNSTHYFAGRIDELAVYNTELSEAQVRAVWEYGPPAYNDVAAGGRFGVYPELDPGAGATNTLELRTDHATAAPTGRLSLDWRSRWA